MEHSNPQLIAFFMVNH